MTHALRQAPLRRLLPHVHARRSGASRARRSARSWAAQRIKNFSLFQAMLSVLGLNRGQVTTLIEEFRYPRLGPGQMWEAVRASRSRRPGFPCSSSIASRRVRHATDRVTSVVVARTATSRLAMPWTASSRASRCSDLVECLEPAPPEHVIQAAAGRLRYRDFCLVALMTSEEAPFPDNWIYLHDPETRAGRVQNYGAWSDGDGAARDDVPRRRVLLLRGRRDLGDARATRRSSSRRASSARIGLIDPSKVFDGVKVRVPKAYPMYDANYEEASASSAAISARFANLGPAGGTGSTATTTRITRCGRRCWRRSTFSTAPTTTSGRSTPRRSTTRREQAVDAALNFDLLAGSEPRREGSGRAGDSELLNL